MALYPCSLFEIFRSRQYVQMTNQPVGWCLSVPMGSPTNVDARSSWQSGGVKLHMHTYPSAKVSAAHILLRQIAMPSNVPISCGWDASRTRAASNSRPNGNEL